jgi:hypothetical protein
LTEFLISTLDDPSLASFTASNFKILSAEDPSATGVLTKKSFAKVGVLVRQKHFLYCLNAIMKKYSNLSSGKFFLDYIAFVKYANEILNYFR